jgi:DNA-dependent RNA polymerase auxiliary subunit epsilon
MSIFDDITQRLDRENNIKHLTLNTKHLTLNTNTLDLPAGESGALRGQSPLSGLAAEPLSASQGIPSQEGSFVSQEGNLALENANFQYIAVSLKTKTLEDRLEVNVDFRLQNSANGKFNKLVFNLVGWSRRREFFANIEEIKDWRGYQLAYKEQGKEDYIGKGRPRVKQAKGSVKRSPIREETAMLLSTIEGEVQCHLWIEDAYFVLPFIPWSDQRQLFCAKAEYINNPGSQRIKRGGWL